MAKKDKALTAPDELQKLGQSTVPFLEQHARSLLYAGGAVLVAFFGWGIFSTISARAEAAAASGLGDALKVLEAEVTSTPPADATTPTFKTEAEKDAAVVQKLSAFRAANVGKKAAASAALPLGQALVRTGKPADAVPLFDEFLAGSLPGDPLRLAALEGRGYALEAQGKLDDALVSFQQLTTETKTDFMKGMGQYHRARLLEQKQDLTQAAAVYAELQTSAPESSAARLSRARLSLLEAKGVKPAPPMPLSTVQAVGADAGS